MNIDQLTIGEAKAIAALFSVGNPPTASGEDHGVQIVVLDRGFVYVGRVRTDAEWVYIEDAKNIRYWGTTKGLGELCDGPLPNTKHDPAGTVRAPKRALIALLRASDKWTAR